MDSEGEGRKSPRLGQAERSKSAWKSASLIPPLQRNSAPGSSYSSSASSSSSSSFADTNGGSIGQSQSIPASPNRSPRGAPVSFSLGKNRSVLPTYEAMRDALMSAEDGVEVSDHKIKLRTYSQCFTAAEAINWLVVHFSLSREEGLNICQRILDEGKMKHCIVSATTRFTDSSDELFEWSDRSNSNSLKQSGLRTRTHIASDNYDSVLGISSSAVSLKSEGSFFGSFPGVGLLDKKRPLVRTFGEDVDRNFPFAEPSFACKAEDNPLHIAKALQDQDMKCLRSLSLCGLGISSEIFLLCMVNSLKKIQGLERLDLSQNGLGFSALVQLLQGWEVINTTLHYLLLENVGLKSGSSSDEVVLWDLVFKRSKIRAVDLTNNDLSDESVAMIAAVVPCNYTIETLLLDVNAISLEGHIPLMQALPLNSSLRTVSMSRMKENAKFKAQRLGSRDGTLSRSMSERNVGSLKQGKKDGRAELIGPLLRCVDLISLTLDDYILTDEHVTKLNRVIGQNCSLWRQELELEGNLRRQASFSSRAWVSVCSQVCDLENLTQLDLSHNMLSALPWSLLRLQQLEVLDVSHNVIQSDSLPVHLSYLPHLIRLDVENNPFVQSLPSVLNWRNVNALLKYFNTILEGSFTCHRVRVLVLGDERTGRTTVAQRLVQPVLSGQHSSLSDSMIHSSGVAGVTVRSSVVDSRVSLEVWDFSNTVIKSPTHQIFVLENCLFVLVVSLDDAGSIQNLDYWVDLIQAKCTRVSFVVVATHQDRIFVSGEELASQLRQRYRSRRYVSIQLVLCLNARSVESTSTWEGLRMELSSMARKELRDWVGRSFSQRFVHCSAMLRAEASLQRMPVTSLSLVRTMMRVARIREHEMDSCFGYLKYSGVIMLFENIPRLKELAILDPLWLMTAMESLARCKLPVLSQKDLESVFCFPAFQLESLNTIVQLLEGFSVMHAFTEKGSLDAEVTKYLVPFLLPEQEAELSLEDRAILLGHKGHTFRRCYEVSSMIHGLFEQLLVRLMHISSRQCAFWKRGCVLMFPAPVSGWDILVTRLITVEGSAITKLMLDITSCDKSGRILHLISSTVEGLIRGWFPGSHLKRLVLLQDRDLDLDVVGEELMKIASAEDLRVFSRSILKDFQLEIPDVLLSHNKRIRWKDVVETKELGSGAYGMVLRGKYKGQDVAVKQVRGADILCLSQPQVFALFLQECWAMNFLKHPKVITLVGVCYQPMSIILEFMELGDLRKFLDMNGASLNWQSRLHILMDIAEGMCFAHSQWPPIIHKDLKVMRSPNVFLTRLGTGGLLAKVADLGLAEVLPKTSRVQGVDNPIWAAIEIIQGGLCTEKVDVWSFAIMMWELLFPMDFPYSDALESMGWMSMVSDGIVHRNLRPTLKPESVEVMNAPSGYVALMQNCWSAEPTERPSFVHILLTLSQMLHAPESNIDVQVEELFSVQMPFGSVLSVSLFDEGELWLLGENEDLHTFNIMSGELSSVHRVSSSDEMGKLSTDSQMMKNYFRSLLCDSRNGGVWICCGTEGMQFCKPHGRRHQKKEEVTGATFVKLESSLDSCSRCAQVGKNLYALGSLRGKLVLGEWTYDGHEEHASGSSSREFVMSRLAIVHQEISEEAVIGCVTIAESRSLWIYSASDILVVNVDQLVTVKHIEVEMAYRSGHLIQLVCINSLKQVWGLVKGGQQILAWDWNGAFVGKCGLPRLAISVLYVQKLNLLCAVEKHGLATYDVCEFSAVPVLAPIAEVVQASRWSDFNPTLDEVFDDVDLSAVLEQHASMMQCSHLLNFVRFVRDLKLRWDPQLSKRVLNEFLQPASPSCVLKYSSFVRQREGACTREEITVIEADVRTWLEKNLLPIFVESYAQRPLRSSTEESFAGTFAVLVEVHGLIVVADQNVLSFYHLESVNSRKVEGRICSSNGGGDGGAPSRVKTMLEKKLDSRAKKSIAATEMVLASLSGKLVEVADQGSLKEDSEKVIEL